MRFVALVLVAAAIGCAVEEENPQYPTGPSGVAPTTTPIVAAAGGTACIGQSTLCVYFPAGALSEDVTVTLRQASGMPTPGAILASSAFNIAFTPDTATFTGTATLTYQLPSISLSGRNLDVAYADTVMNEWAFDGISNVAHTPGASLDVVSADTTHFTAFAVVDMDVLVGCACDIDSTCTAGCACDADCCACDIDSTCTAGCACDADCCACDIDSTCTVGCVCDADCCACDIDGTCSAGCDCDPDCGGTAAPVAIVDYVACPATPCTDPAAIAPLDRVYLDGTGSYDPDDPLNPSAITTWQWEILSYPAGVTPGDLAPGPSTQPTFDFVVPAEGLYDVTLSVWDTDGQRSVDTADSWVTVVVMAVVAEDIRISLAWDTDADLDLHFTLADQQPDLLCNSVVDCFYDNTMPLWFTTFPAGDGPNPHMDMDSGAYGPETIVIDEADEAVHYYNVYVHYYDASGSPTNATVTLTVDGTPSIFQRQLQPQEVWAVATVVTLGGMHLAQEYTTDGLGQGAVATMPGGACNAPGWDFPL